ncbi:hypothetical protein ABEX98_05135 [Bacillus subtilis]|uniref:hypothetical protein n=1 Tax=Bacillus TaxID=1386 RepID=UPI0002A1425B|nr:MULTISPECIES: hypothetical protein [Bacillus]AGA24290.1 hypothetical protein A7A1_3672 [Bacillus subtilis subsp. subtilis str. BSP1]AKE24123.1 hypothetical protein BsLM_2325 [Bacillus sp. LM 4-2]MEC1312144.1 hypothetical protein [Bacillus subtilis]RAP10396.1 hypothetical protein HS3_00811 [Bacillus subtilis]WBU32818.1 hypothetical protein OSK17_12950 [Bacillus subtilis]
MDHIGSETGYEIKMYAENRHGPHDRTREHISSKKCIRVIMDSLFRFARVLRGNFTPGHMNLWSVRKSCFFCKPETVYLFQAVFSKGSRISG